ncbi:MAG: hypothetical protein IT542_13790 [Rubellimicrobium sp.]|nr:hypothetical protein [Rubellimicrobium sp.]
MPPVPPFRPLPARLRARSAALVLSAALLAGCAPHAEPGAVAASATADLSTCGRGAGGFDGMATLAAPIMPVLTTLNREILLRDGRLERFPEAIPLLEATLQPLDVVLTSRRHSVGGAISPGYFTHGIVYLGTETQLQALGLLDDPAIAPHRAEIAAGATLAEANGAPVALVTLARVLDADGAAVFRPRGLSRQALRDGLRTTFASRGLPFDHRFDGADGDAIFCTELVDRALPDARLPRDTVGGHEVVLPDRIASAALTGASPLEPVLFLYADAQGLHRGSTALLRATIAANWPAPPDTPLLIAEATP